MRVIRLPEESGPLKRKSKYHFDDMKVDEHVFIKGKNINQVWAVLAKKQKETGMRFEAVTVDGGVKVRRKQ
jgi:hypothetical protein